MRLLQILFGVLWVVGYVGNGTLFLYVEWTYLRQGFVQIFNPFLHLQVLGTLLTTPLFWIFLAMALLGYYATISIEKRLKRNGQHNELTEEQLVPEPLFDKQELQASIPATPPVPITVKQIDEQDSQKNDQQVKLLEWAIQSSQKVQFIYEPQDGKKSDYTVTPIELETVEEALCLATYCHLNQTRRAFVIKRMRGLKIVSPDVISSPSYSLRPPITFAPVLPSQPSVPPLRIVEPEVSVQNNAPPTDPLTQKSPPDPLTQNRSPDSQSQERPYIQLSFDELRGMANAQWSNVQVLEKIHHELKFRSRKKSQALCECIAQRLTQLQSISVFPKTTVTTDSQNPLPSKVFTGETGLLRQYGYRVGANGLPEHQRRQILDRVFLEPFPFVNDTALLRKWGEPNTSQRLKKIANCIAAFTRNAKRNKTSDYSEAIQDWEADLTYLKRTYYDGRFDFRWSQTGISRL